MMTPDFIYVTHWFFLCLGGILLASELIGAGGYSLWSGVAAFFVGLIAWIFPALSWVWLWLIFALLTVIIACLWWKWSSRHKQNKHDKEPYLNERNKQLIGRQCEVVQAITDHYGRVQVGDGTWLAYCEVDLPIGAKVNVIDIANITLIVKPYK